MSYTCKKKQNEKKNYKAKHINLNHSQEMLVINQAKLQLYS